MKAITFDNIYKQGQIVFENTHYRHHHFPELLLMYDGNFIEYKTMPTVEEFKNAATYLRDFHVEKGQQHIKFYLPENEKPTSELVEYLKAEEYDYGFLELYAIKPDQFPRVENVNHIRVSAVTEETLDIYLALQFEQELAYGENFAQQKVAVHKANFQNPNIMQVLAMAQGEAAGSVDVIISEETAEIDGLFVKESFRKKGIAHRLQQFVMEQFQDKTVILVADGDDTPRKMYQKQNYSFIGFQYEILKIFSN